MKNHEVYLRDPRTWSLANNGVARVNEPGTAAELRVLRSELETFVCEGEYARGMARILERYLDNLARNEQPGVWVSGFYGSGKSHFVKMLRALWSDVRFDDGATARGLVPNLPVDVADPLKRLNTEAKRLGTRLHAASGALTASVGGSVRRAVVAVAFGSLGFDGDFAIGSFELWLREQGILNSVRDAVRAKGLAWEDERAHFYVSPAIAGAVMAARPQLANSPADLHTLFAAQFANPADISTETMVQVVRRALRGDSDQIPLTLFVLDEVQQFIGELPTRATDVQEVAEALQKQFDGRVVLVGTGQSAMGGTPMLQRIQARFTLPIPLGDQDVEKVIRKVVLQKSAAAIGALQTALDAETHEISRHLPNATLRHRDDDREALVPDYPILPARRRFWEQSLRAIDGVGTSAQLRNQLSLSLEAARATADLPVGHVIGAEFVVDNQEVNLLNVGVMPKSVHEKLQAWRAGGAGTRLKVRLGTLVFLIARLDRSKGSDCGVRATPADLTDLLVTDLHAGARALRADVEATLAAMEGTGDLMLVDGEYRWQTREGGVWRQRFTERCNQLLGDVTKYQLARADLLKSATAAALKKLSLTQGVSTLKRDWEIVTSDGAPKADGTTLPLWLRDEATTTEAEVRRQMLALGNDSPVVAIVLPRHREAELRTALVERDAAASVLASPPSTAGGDAAERVEAQKAMTSRQVQAAARVDALVRDVLEHAKVLLGGGGELTPTVGVDDPFLAMVRAASQQSLDRLFPYFPDGDHASWEKVVTRVRKNNDVEALKAVDHAGDPLKHKVVVALLKYLGAAKTGREFRTAFMAAPYGWSQEAVDGALYTLLALGQLRAMDNNVPMALAQVDVKKLGSVSLVPVKVVASAAQKGEVRKLLPELGVPNKMGEEIALIGEALHKLDALAKRAGAEAPAPPAPDTTLLQKLRGLVDQDLLVETAARADELRKAAVTWTKTAASIDARRPRWALLTALLAHAEGVGGLDAARTQVDAVRTQRLLLQDPDPVAPVLDAVTQALRTALTEVVARYRETHAAGMATLSADAAYVGLDPAAREALLDAHGLRAPAAVPTASAEEVLAALDRCTLAAWGTRVEALPTRFQAARLEAAKRLEPQAVPVSLPRRTLRSPAEVDAWVDEVRALLAAKVASGPVIV